MCLLTVAKIVGCLEGQNYIVKARSDYIDNFINIFVLMTVAKIVGCSDGQIIYIEKWKQDQVILTWLIYLCLLIVAKLMSCFEGQT